MAPSESLPATQRPGHLTWLLPLVAFVLAALLSGALVGESERQARAEERARVADTLADQAHALERHLERALSLTYSLGALVRHGGGEVPDFEAVGGELRAYHPGVAALSLAPDGVQRRVVPLGGNEASIGHDLLSDPLRSKEARAAIETGRLTLAGPFPLKQGGLGVAGRLPVFVDQGSAHPRFWGFTIVLLRFPEALQAVGLADVARRGYVYQLWRTHPDDGHRQVIAGSATAPMDAPVERTVQVANATWTLAMAPAAGWGAPAGIAARIALALLVSALVAYLARLWVMLQAHRRGLEGLVERRTAELAEREADLKRAQSVAQVGSWAADLTEGERGVTLSAEGRRILGLPDGAPFGFEAFMARVDCEDRDAVARAWRGARDGARIGVECRIDVQGRLRWIRAKAELARRADGRRRVVGTLQDITERKQADQALRVAAAAFETNDGIVVCDANRIIQQVNRNFVRITGFVDSDVVGRPARVLQSGRHDAAFYAAMWRSIEATGSWAGEVLNRRRSGEEYPAWLTVTAVRGESAQVTNYVATLVDITERKAAEEKIARLAFFDPLTRLPNRRLLMDRVQHALAARARSGSGGALLFLDLDHFKQLNDTHGHDRGDHLLQEVARRLACGVRTVDTVARFGGDEFVVLLEGLDPERAHAERQARAIAHGLLGALNEPFDLDGLPYRTTPSIGLTVFDTTPVTVVELLKQADMAMYQAKAAGRNAVRAWGPELAAPTRARPAEEGEGETTW